MSVRLALLALLFSASAVAQTAAEWNADIDHLASELPKRHPNPFTITSREAFEAQLQALKQQTAGLSRTDIAIRLQQAVASLHDGHTELDTSFQPMTWFPLRLYLFEDGLYVTKTTAESRAACGAKLIAVDGVDAGEVYARVATTISAENEQWLRARVPKAMTRAETLKALGVIASDEARFTFQSPYGSTFDLVLRAAPAAVSSLDATTPDLPLYRRHPELRYWYEWIPAQRLLYVKYNVCSNDPANPFANLERDVLAILDGETVDRFVIDVRDNTGGSTEVARSLINNLARRPQLRGRFFVIIGRHTFSSALLNALDLQKAGAQLVGEPTGGKPNSYGEVRSFVLPRTQLVVHHSTRRFTIVAGDPPFLAPDVHVTVTSEDFFRKRDPVLEAIVGAPAVAAHGASSGRRRAVSPGRSCPQ